MHITYRTTTLGITNWRDGHHRNLRECEEEAAKLSKGFIPQMKEYEEDDWADKSRGIGWAGKDQFLDNPRCVFKELINDPTSGFATVDACGKIILNTTAMSETLDRCNRLGLKIALLCLFTPGQSPRIKEFVDYRLVNGTMRGRNLFRDGTDVWLVNRRVKSETLVGHETFIPTKCYPRLSRLLEQYFFVIRPLEKELAYQVYGKQAYQEYSDYAWVQGGEKITADRMYKELEIFLHQYCEIKAGIQVYRQLCVEIGRTFLGSEFEIVQDQLELLSAQRGHSLRVEQAQYAPGVHHLPGMSSDLLLRYGRISETWWEVLGLKPGQPPLLPLCQRAKSAGKAKDELLTMIRELLEELKRIRE